MISEQTEHRILLLASLATLLVSLLLGISGTLILYRNTRLDKTIIPSVAAELKLPILNESVFNFDGATFKKSGLLTSSAHHRSPLGRYRLAGTFFATGINQRSRKAIIDDLQKQEQMLVSEGDQLDGTIVVYSIRSDKIILRYDGAEEEIMLSFAGSAKTNAIDATYSDSNLISESTENRFGKRVGDKRWVLSRESIMNYYKEVLNDTDRLAKIYDSLKPIYKDGSIAGYTLVIEGEAEMFKAFGLQEGDIIRQVNSMPMTSQNRAEYFINEFVKNRVNGFVLDIERSGQKDRLIYMIR